MCTKKKEEKKWKRKKHTWNVDMKGHHQYFKESKRGGQRGSWLFLMAFGAENDKKEENHNTPIQGDFPHQPPNCHDLLWLLTQGMVLFGGGTSVCTA